MDKPEDNFATASTNTYRRKHFAVTVFVYIARSAIYISALIINLLNQHHLMYKADTSKACVMWPSPHTVRTKSYFSFGTLTRLCPTLQVVCCDVSLMHSNARLNIFKLKEPFPAIKRTGHIESGGVGGAASISLHTHLHSVSEVLSITPEVFPDLFSWYQNKAWLTWSHEQ